EQTPMDVCLSSWRIGLVRRVVYPLVFLGIWSDIRLVVVTRRELGAFFHSPIAYIVLIGMAGIGWLNYWVFANRIFEASEGGMQRGGLMPEPIVYPFLVSFLALIPLMFLVPIITMRMVSEEKRSGTLEVLLTAPVNEWHIVLSKFLAGLRVFLLCFYLCGVFFVALRMEGGEPFDYRSIVTFLIALVCMGSG